MRMLTSLAVPGCVCVAAEGEPPKWSLLFILSRLQAAEAAADFFHRLSDGDEDTIRKTKIKKTKNRNK